MPTYQYLCTECGTPLEAQQAFSDAPLTECTTCGGRLRKVFSPVGVVFKGSGFYRNDSKVDSKSDSKGEPKDDRKPDDKGESKDKKSEQKNELKSDSKPDSKPDSKAGSST